MKFVKMHGCGNDYVYLDAVTAPEIERLIDQPGWTALVERMSDRHKGIGSDGVIVVCSPTELGRREHSHVRMRMFNRDGSESEMCGNGVRCVAKMAHDRLGIRASTINVETGRGMLSISHEVSGGSLTHATVDMGAPILELGKIPVDPRQVRSMASPHQYALDGFKGGAWVFVSMGNPHAVLVGALGPETALSRAREWGPVIQSLPAFPRRTNVHFLGNVARNSVDVVTWERGAGITQACGTGACAVVVAGVLAGLVDREATVRVLGGELNIRWDEASNHVFMTGEAIDVYEGDWPE